MLAEAAGRQRRLKLPSPRDLPIDTFVVLMMENRSFDHYLGWMPGADRRQAGLEFTDGEGQKFSTHRFDFSQSCGVLDPDRSWESRSLVVLYRARLRFRRHRLAITVLRGPVALQGLAITGRRS